MMAAKYYFNREMLDNHDACQSGINDAYRAMGKDSDSSSKITVTKRNYIRFMNTAREDIKDYPATNLLGWGKEFDIYKDSGLEYTDEYVQRTWEAIKKKLSINDKGEAV